MEKLERSIYSLFKMGIAIQNFNKRSERKLGLSVVQWCLLRQLIDMPASSAFSLATALGIHPSTLTQTLKRLEQKGFVYTSLDPKDSRKKLISITRSGKEKLDETSCQISDLPMEFSKIDVFMNELATGLATRLV